MLHRTLVVIAWLALAGVLGAAPAHADDAPDLSDSAPLVMPDMSERTRTGVDVFFASNERHLGAATFEKTAVTFEPYLDLALTPQLTLWGRLPIAHARSRSRLGTLLENERSDNLLGNAGLGARIMTQVSYDLRAGGGVLVHLPTARAGDEPEGLSFDVANVRPFQRERYVPNTATVGAHADVRFEVGRTFLQGQLVYMHLLAEDEDYEYLDLLRLGLANGFWVTSTIAIMTELTTLSTILEDDNVQFDAEDFFHSLDVGLRFAQPQWSLSVRFHLPLDEIFRDDDLLGGGADLAVYF